MQDGAGPGSDTVLAPSGQPARVLAAWIAELIEDVHGEHVARLAQLRERLQAQAFAWDCAWLAQSGKAMLLAARRLDLDALAPRSWWQRMTRSAATASRDFQRDHDELVAAAAKARVQLDELSDTGRPHLSAARKIVVELGLEHRSLAREIDQGVAWLSELTSGLSGPVSDTDPESRRWAAAAEAAASDLKALHSINALVGDIHVAGTHVLERRTALLEQVRKNLERFDSMWRPRIEVVVTASLAHPRNLREGLQSVDNVHAELLDRLEAADAAGAALQAQEQGLERLLAALRDPLAGR